MRIPVLEIPGFGAAAGLAVLAAVGAGCANTAEPGTVVALETRNASAAASKVIGSMQTLLDAGDRARTDLTGAPGQIQSSGSSVAAFAAAQLTGIAQLNGQGLSPAAQTTIACDKGDYSVEKRGNSGGDTYLLAYNQCYDKLSRVTYQGNVTLRNVAVTGDLSQPGTAGSMAATFDVNGLTISAASRGSVTTLQGTFDYTAVNGDGVTLDQSISGTRMSMERGGDLIILYSFEARSSNNDNTTDFTVSLSGGLHSDSLGGTLNFATPQTLTGQTRISPDPRQGLVRIDGRLNSMVQIKALSGAAQIDIDSNGDGKRDFTLHSRWGALT